MQPSIFRLSRQNPRLAEDVLVAGYPFGFDINTTVKVTKGVVSSLAGFGDTLSQFQLDAVINAGNSGDPIFNDSGTVVGVLVAGMNARLAPADLIKLARKIG